MQTQPTPHNDINYLLTELLTAMQTILGEQLVGLYLYGSLVTGDFDPQVSDIDLLAVIASELSDEAFYALHTMHDNFVARHKEWDNRIEVAYVSAAALKTYRTQRSLIAVISPGEPFHHKEAGRDWLINWYLVREKGVTLFGPTPDKFIDLITKEEWLQAVREYTSVWREWIQHTYQRKEQAYAILTLCRAYYTLSKGEYPSKKQAALWAAEKLPEWASFIKQALVWRSTAHDEDVDHVTTIEETRRFVHYMIGLCQ